MNKIKAILVTIILLLTMYYMYKLGQQEQQQAYKQMQTTRVEKEKQISKEIKETEKVTGDIDKLMTNMCC